MFNLSRASLLYLDQHIISVMNKHERIDLRRPNMCLTKQVVYNAESNFDIRINVQIYNLDDVKQEYFCARIMNTHMSKTMCGRRMNVFLV